MSLMRTVEGSGLVPNRESTCRGAKARHQPRQAGNLSNERARQCCFAGRARQTLHQPSKTQMDSQAGGGVRQRRSNFECPHLWHCKGQPVALVPRVVQHVVHADALAQRAAGHCRAGGQERLLLEKTSGCRGLSVLLTTMTRCWPQGDASNTAWPICPRLVRSAASPQLLRCMASAGAVPARLGTPPTP